MLRRTPMNRGRGFLRSQPAPDRKSDREKRRAANVAALLASPGRQATYGGATGEQQPKPEPKRNSALLDMARGRPCLLLVPGICNHSLDTTCACHSNLSIHGKAGARKADDCYSAWGCSACHRWLDQGSATAAQKEAAFMGAHSRQVLAWRQIASDPSEPERFRRAARWALEQLGAMPC
jgi:hypothetical protein